MLNNLKYVSETQKEGLMPNSFIEGISQLAEVDLFKKNQAGEIDTGVFVGRPFYLDYEKAFLLIADAWKHKAKGIPQGSFLFAYYENEQNVQEAMLLRVLRPSKLPTDSDMIGSMVEYYKDNLKTSGKDNQLDSFTKYEFSFSGLECRILGTFYKDNDENIQFGADIENFFSAHHYRVVKPNSTVLGQIVKFREGNVVGQPTDIKIGKVRYSSSIRYQDSEENVPVYVSPQDFLGKRTALFGMTRTGKSNTVKKVIEATMQMNTMTSKDLDKSNNGNIEDNLEPFTNNNLPKYPAGQIIFDINGEYSNANLQDQGTAIFELYNDKTIRYSTIEKPNFKIMKVNFYNDIASGFNLINLALKDDNSDYVNGLLAMDFEEPEDESDVSAMTRYNRKKAAYFCNLYKAGFPVPQNFKVTFEGNKTLNEMAGNIDPKNGISLEQASNWFSTIWENYSDNFFINYKATKGREWADEDLKALLVFLTRKKSPSAVANLSRFRKLKK